MCNGSDFSFSKLISKTPELEFVSVRGDEMFYECRKQGYDRINITSDNVDDQTGHLVTNLLNTLLPTLYFHQFPYLALMHMFQYLPQTSEME